ncbi:MAG TPA: cysteine synthase A [Candidatus Saccharimonadales bacterium]|nr:cysteine synthase A [Candidatus Saccharimonadales bacterium]
MVVADSILDLIGHTPMVKLKHISKDVPAEIWAKLEFMNPSGSVKDRIALAMIEKAEQEGKLKPGGTIVEPTSGNTGIALSLVAAVKGYKMIAVMPAAMSRERALVMQFLGAKVELVPTKHGIPGMFVKEDIENTLKRAIEICEQTPNSFMPNQFDNPHNPDAHAETTAQEIIEQAGSKLAAFVAACGTGGTFSGVARVLKAKHPKVKKIVVEPANSAVISGEAPGMHKIQGVGEGFVPNVMDCDLADEISKVSDEDAITMAKRLAHEEGIVAGFSGGANVVAALEAAKKLKKGDIVVTIIADNTLRYLSTDLCQDPEPVTEQTTPEKQAVKV